MRLSSCRQVPWQPEGTSCQWPINWTVYHNGNFFSALGQVKLVGLYYDLFREYGIHIGQVLTMKESFSTRGEYLNQRACMNVMLENGVVPIVNENDTTSVWS